MSAGDSVRFSLDYDINDLLYKFDFSGDAATATIASTSDNCQLAPGGNDVYYCLHMMKLGKAFTPHATLATAVEALYDNDA